MGLILGLESPASHVSGVSNLPKPGPRSLPPSPSTSTTQPPLYTTTSTSYFFFLLPLPLLPPPLLLGLSLLSSHSFFEPLWTVSSKLCLHHNQATNRTSRTDKPSPLDRSLDCQYPIKSTVQQSHLFCPYDVIYSSPSSLIIHITSSAVGLFILSVP